VALLLFSPGCLLVEQAVRTTLKVQMPEITVIRFINFPPKIEAFTNLSCRDSCSIRSAVFHFYAITVSLFRHNVGMKRCPQCQFIYPDSDELCDFDKTPLAFAAESEIEEATHPVQRPALSELAAAHSTAIATRRTRKTLPIAAGLGLMLGLAMFIVYYGLSTRVAPAPAAQSATALPTQSVAPPQSQVQDQSPTPGASPSPIETPVQSTKPTSASARTSTAHSNLSTGPVSTSGGAVSTGKPVILLTSGGRVEADEVWRTKDGVWYRKNGVVTLLKKNRVKAIVNQ
jgi:hypothetical protein